ncbi:MAG: YccF domain-containing protein [Eubacteriales bacterium]
MKTIGNIIWFLFGGFIAFILWSIAGILVCITIIGIPFGMQCFKVAGYVIWPFKKDVIIGKIGAGRLIGDILWILIFGWEFAAFHLIIALIFFITIIGIPFGKQHLKFAQLSIVPFNSKVISKVKNKG